MLVLSFMVSLFLTAFAIPKAVGQPPKAGGTLRVAMEGDMSRRMDPRYLEPPSLYPPAWNIFEFLVAYGPGGMQEVIPGLAESWKRVDPLTYLFYLRKGVRFHNGREMSAEDIRANFDWLLKTPEGWMPLRRRGMLTEVIDKIETVDRSTLRIKLKLPFAPLLAGIRMVAQGIAPPEEVKKWGKDFTLHPSGTGPFKFVETVVGDRVVLEHFEGYWGKKPYLDRVIFRTIPDEHARVIALQTGEIDVARVMLSSLPTVRKDPNLKIDSKVSGVFGIRVWFNTRHWPTSSIKFRQAVAAGAQWDKYPAAAYAGYRARPHPVPYDPERARRLVKEVEAEAGKPIPTLTVYTPLIYHFAQMATLAKTQLKQIGIDLKVSSVEGIVRYVQTLKWDMAMAGLLGATGDPYFSLNAFTTMGVGDMPDNKNVPGYVNPRIDELLKQAAMTDERGAREKVYQEVEGILFKDLPAFYLYSSSNIWAFNKKVQDPGFTDEGTIYVTSPWNNTWIAR